MNVRVQYTQKSLRDLQKLGPATARVIVQKIRFYTEQENPLRYAKKLKQPFDDLYRFRIGNYRAVFELGNTGHMLFLTILKIGDRKDVYE